MSIERFYTETVTVTRMTWANESSAQVSVGTFKGHIQQANPEYSRNIGLALGKTFIIWCHQSTDVEPGDKLTIDTGAYAGKYTVKNIMQNEIGVNKHITLATVKDVA